MSAVAMATVKGQGHPYPQAELYRLWKLLLLNQFHDVLPGSSIGMVRVKRLIAVRELP